MPQTTAVQVAPVAKPVVKISALVSQENVKQKFQEMLGDKTPGFLSSVISVANSPALIGADANSVLSSASVAASFDLPVNPNLGFAYIVPYNVKEGGVKVKKAQFQMGYKGFIQLAQRSGQYKTINATDIREGELIENNILSGEVKIKSLGPDREKAKVVGYAAYFELLNGFSKTLYMSKEEMESHATKYSQSYRFDKDKSSIWSTQFDTMAKKTVLKLLLSKFGPLTIDTQMQRAIALDQAVIKNDETGKEEYEYVDNIEDVVEVDEDVQQAPGRSAAVEAAASLFENENKN